VAREPDNSMRVSDAERDETLKILGEQAAVGRLTLEEHQERSGKALAAKTRGELAALTSDLPGEDLAARVPARREARWMVTIMGGTTVCRLPPQARGLDLREARRLAKSAGRGELPSG
jgi:hypothetical protein